MPSLTWYRQRLRAMPPAEIPWRAWRLARQWLGRCRTWPEARDLPLAAIWHGDCSAEMFRSWNVGFPPVPDEEALARLPKAWRDGTVEEAENLLAHRFTLFALTREHLGEAIDWNRDYSSGKCVPLEYAPALDYRSSDRVGDVKYVWELGRMQHLTRLAQAWRLTRDDRFPREIVAQVTSWIDQCPHMMGIHWTSPMDAALRLISWSWAVHLVADWEGLRDEFVQLLVRSIDQHLRFIDRNYSLSSSANNHLVAEASGAYFSASYWFQLKYADRWRGRAKRHLVRECLRQNYPDGVNKEQAFAYEFFVWDLFLLAALIGRARGDDFPKAYWRRLERMAEFMACVSDFRGHTPNIGDRDDGIAVDLGQDRAHPALGMLATTASVWQRVDFRAWAGSDGGEWVSWLTGSSPASSGGGQLQTSQAVAARTSHHFPNGGYYVFRDGFREREILLLFDVGPLGWPATAVHGHADALSIVLHLAGEPVLVDPGTFSYQDTERRRSDRGTAQHNTLWFGGADQAEYINRFVWGTRPEVNVLSVNSTNGRETVEAEVRWWTGALHRRRVDRVAGSQKFTVTDSWTGPEPPGIGFSLAPGLAVETAPHEFLVATHGFRLRIANESTPGDIADIHIAPRCYREEPSVRIRFRPTKSSGRTVTDISWDFE